jgi:hypothetical protein
MYIPVFITDLHAFYPVPDGSSPRPHTYLCKTHLEINIIRLKAVILIKLSAIKLKDQKLASETAYCPLNSQELRQCNFETLLTINFWIIKYGPYTNKEIN